MDQQVYFNSEFKYKILNEKTLSTKNAKLVVKIKPETKWSNYEQVESNAATFIEGLNSCMWKNTEMICG